MGKNSNCKKCSYSSQGKPDNSSDICDGCQYDPDSGWGGYTDHSSTGPHNRPEEMKSKKKKRDEYNGTWSFT